MSQKSGNQRKVPQPPGLGPMDKALSLAMHISKQQPAPVKTSTTDWDAMGDSNTKKTDEIAERSSIKDDSNVKTNILAIEKGPSLQSRKKTEGAADLMPKSDRAKPILASEKFKHFHDEFYSLGRSYVSNLPPRQKAIIRLGDTSIPRSDPRRDGDNGNNSQTANMNKMEQSQTKLRSTGNAHSDNLYMVKEKLFEKRRREKELLDAENARLQEAAERLFLGGDPVPITNTSASQVDSCNSAEEDLMSFSPVKPKEKTRSRYLDIPIDYDFQRQLLNYGRRDTESFTTFALGLNSGTASGQSTPSIATNQDVNDRDKHLSEEQINALQAFRDKYQTRSKNTDGPPKHSKS